MSFSFSLNSKSQFNGLKKSTTFFSDAAETGSSTIHYVREFCADVAPPQHESEIKSIAPIPDEWLPKKHLENLANLPQVSALQFELYPGSNPEESYLGYGLNLRQGATIGDAPTRNLGGTVSERNLRDDLGKLPEVPGLDEYEDVPVEGFGAALLAGYGWKEGGGIGLNSREDVKIYEFSGGKLLGTNGNGNDGVDIENAIAKQWQKMEDRKDKFAVGKDMQIVNRRDKGIKGKILEERDGGDLFVLRMSKSNEKVEVRTRDVAVVGSSEEKCVKLKDSKAKAKDVLKKDSNLSRKRGRGELKARSERVNWLMNHIRVRIISEEFKGGRLFLKKGVVVDVVGPGLCDILIDESREIVQGVDQEILETALPKHRGPVLVLYGRHKDVYGSLLERDSKKNMGVVRDANTHELLNVKLEQIAEYMGDPSDIVY